MADPVKAAELSRRALLRGRFFEGLSTPAAPEQPLRPQSAAAPLSEPPLSEVHVHGSARPVPTLSVESGAGESPPPWSRPNE